jgi:hypothetical protein
VNWHDFAAFGSVSFSARNHLSQALAALSLALVLFLTGCEKKGARKPSAAEIHGITQELAAAAAPHATTVKVRKSATDSDASSRDALSISLPAASSPNARAAAPTTLLQSLDQVITRHQLTQDEPITSPNSLRMVLRRAGTVTHEIEIATRSAAVSSAKTSGETPAPRLAIILDDLGSDPAAAQAIFALHYPVTLSILPGHAHSTEIAQEAHRRGLEVLLHIPMQSVGKEQAEAQELRPGMPASQVATLVDDFLTKIPGVAGVNNHQGSQATSNQALMNELMPILRDRQLFYVDSRTTAATVAYDAAKKAGVPCGFRNVPFLDDVEEVAAVRKQLALAFKGAKEKGDAIAIGHPHPATLEALRELLPRAEAQGIRLVPVSEIVH